MSQDESFQDVQGPNPPLVQLLEEESNNNSRYLGGGVDTAAVGKKRPDWPLENGDPDCNWQDIAAAPTVGPLPLGWCSPKVGQVHTVLWVRED